MPKNREPAVYSGFVISKIGNTAGQRVEMDYHVAQSNVASGMADWDDKPVVLDRQLAKEVAARNAVREGEIAADAAHYANLTDPPKSVESAMVDNAQPMNLVTEDGVVYLASPFPQVAKFDTEFVDDAGATAGIVAREEKVISVNLHNAAAIYDVVDEKDGVIVAELREAALPEVEIPADWRDMNHLQTIPMAKKLRELDKSAKVNKAEAEAIIEEWTKADDQVSEDGAAATGEGGAGTAEGENRETGEAHGRVKNGNHEPGADEEARKRAAEKEAAFARGDDDGA